MKNRTPVASEPRARPRRLRAAIGIAFTVTGLALLAGTGPSAHAYLTQPDGNYDGVTTLEPNASDTCEGGGRWVKFTLGGKVEDNKTASAVANQPYDMQYDELEAPDKGAHLINIDSVTSTADPTGPRAFSWVFTHAGGNSRDFWNWGFATPVLTTPSPLDPGGHSNTNQLILCVVPPPEAPTTTTSSTTTTSTTTTTTTTTTTSTTILAPTVPPPIITVSPTVPPTVPPTAPPPVSPTVPPPVLTVPTPTVVPTAPPTTVAAVVSPAVVTPTTLSITASPTEVAGEIVERQLPFTGADTSALTILALALIAGGLVLALVPDRKARTS